MQAPVPLSDVVILKLANNGGVFDKKRHTIELVTWTNYKFIVLFLKFILSIQIVKYDVLMKMYIDIFLKYETSSSISQVYICICDLELTY